jgi:Do/DeqQ family serine protease
LRLSRLLVPAIAVLAACSDPVGRADAQTGTLPDESNRQVPQTPGQMQLSFAPVVRRAAPAVVNVLTARQRPRDPFYQLYGGGQPQQQTRVAPTGSGVIVRPDGYIITNNHVIEGATEIRVGLSDRRELPARVLLADPRVDLAVLKIDTSGEQLPFINVDVSEQPQIGDLVLALGNPFGVGQTVTSGIVSATERSGSSPLSREGITDIASFIQTDAAINPGNSGGALVDMDGDLIGINTAILSRSGTSSGVGFAVPAALVRQVLNTAAGGGRRVVRPYLGVGTDPITTERARELGLATPQGLLVSTITSGSPAARAGLRQNDVILSVNGVPVNETSALTFQIASRSPGETVPIQIRRNGRAETLRVRLEATPELPAEQRTLTGAHPLSGATVANLSGDILDQARVSALNAREGVLVVDPGTGYAGRRAGFRQFDLITEVNGRAVRTVGELQAALASSGGWRIGVRRGGRDIVGNFEAE